VLSGTGTSVSGWVPTSSSGAIYSDVSMCYDYSGSIHLFGVGGDGRVYEQILSGTGTPVSGWVPTSSGGYITSNNISVYRDINNNIHLFGVAGDGRVYEQDLNPGGSPFNAWYPTSTAGVITSNVKLYSDSYGNMHLFGAGGDSRVYEQDITTNPSAGWFATSSTGAIYSDVSAGDGGGAPSGTSVLGSLVGEPMAGRLYQPASGALWNPNTNTPSYKDVQQGGIGDCWLVAALAETAARAPGDITSMFSYAGTATEDGYQVSLYNVRFYDGNNVAHTVTVDTLLPMGGAFYDNPVSGSANNSTTPVLWVALAEKAYAEATKYGYVTTDGCGYGALFAGGVGATVLRAITGKSASHKGFSTSDITTAWQNGQLITLGTNGSTTAINGVNIAGNHEYAVVGYDSSTQQFTLFNPWGVNGGTDGNTGLFCAGIVKGTGQQLAADFGGESIDSSAAPGGRVDLRARSSEELVDLAFIDNPVDEHSKTQSDSAAVSVHDLASSANAPSLLPNYSLQSVRSRGLHLGSSEELIDLAFIDGLTVSRLSRRSRDARAFPFDSSDI
jgi:hypothetical protein